MTFQHQSGLDKLDLIGILTGNDLFSLVKHNCNAHIDRMTLFVRGVPEQQEDGLVQKPRGDTIG